MSSAVPSRRSTWLRDLDLPRIGTAAVIAAAFALGLAFAFLGEARSRSHVGPTAAGLDEGFSAWLGAGLGLAVGSAVCALWVGRGPRLLSGVLAGLAAYLSVVAPAVVLSRPSDVGVGEALGIALYLIPFAALFAALGASVGRLASGLLRR